MRPLKVGRVFQMLRSFSLMVMKILLSWKDIMLLLNIECLENCTATSLDIWRTRNLLALRSLVAMIGRMSNWLSIPNITLMPTCIFWGKMALLNPLRVILRYRKHCFYQRKALSRLSIMVFSEPSLSFRIMSQSEGVTSPKMMMNSLTKRHSTMNWISWNFATLEIALQCLTSNPWKSR